MKRLVGLFAIAVLAVVAYAAGGRVVGQGGFYFGEFGVAALTLEANAGQPQNTVMQFASDGHEHGNYPDAVIIMTHAERVSIGNRTMLLIGRGFMHSTEVSIRAYAYDGEGTNNPDRFEIWCRNSRNQLVYHMDGDIEIGDISITRN
jgi:hypothetical protein